MRGFFLIIAALFIDGLQGMMSIALAGISGSAGIALQAIPGVGTIAGAAVVPIGIILGFIVNACISLTFGVGLIAALAFEGMAYPGYLGSVLFAEVVPGLDNLPLWTGIVILCLMKKKSTEGGMLGAAAALATAALKPSPGAIKTAAQSMDGIRAKIV
jgi:hypothetical protein